MTKLLRKVDDEIGNKTGVGRVGTGGLGWHLNRRQGRLDSEQGRRKKVRHHI